MQQRDAGTLRLDDPVGRHLAWFHLKRTEGEGDVTIEGLLTHASGRRRSPASRTGRRRTFSFPRTRRSWRRSRPSRRSTRPRRTSSIRTSVSRCRRDRRRDSGQTYAAYAKEKILSPLGLTSTTPEIPVAERGRRLAVGYSSRDREGRRQPLPFFTINAVAPAAGYASDVPTSAAWRRGSSACSQRRHGGAQGDDAARDAAHPLGRARLRNALGPRVPHLEERRQDLRRPRRQLPGVSLGPPDQPPRPDRDRVPRERQSLDSQDRARKLYDIVAPATRPRSRSRARARRRTRRSAPTPGRTTPAVGGEASCCRGRTGSRCSSCRR